MAAELEVGRTRVEEELVATAQLVTHLEARLREALGRIDESETVSADPYCGNGGWG